MKVVLIATVEGCDDVGDQVEETFDEDLIVAIPTTNAILTCLQQFRNRRCTQKCGKSGESIQKN